MTPTYANKFQVEINDMVRIVFQDERPQVPAVDVSSVILTKDNAVALVDLITKLLNLKPVPVELGPPPTPAPEVAPVDTPAPVEAATTSPVAVGQP